VSTAKKVAARFRVGDWVMFPYGTGRVAAEVVEDRGVYGSVPQRNYRIRPEFGTEESVTFDVPEEQLEIGSRPDKEQWARLTFNVRYIRQGNTNKWTATTKKGKLLRGVAAKGAVAYSAARWGPEREEDETSAVVMVFVECDPRVNGPNFVLPPQIWTAFAKQALGFADDLFKSKHPNAIVKHADLADED
jgi:hypothetical protein